MSNLYKLPVTELTKNLNTNLTTGLSKEQASNLLRENGPNELEEKAIKSPWKILWEQLSATMVVILIFAAIISAFLGDYKDAIAIMAIVILNALLGLSQEFKAEKAIAALKKLAVPSVKVRRSNDVVNISARELVVGDVVIIETGNIIPADCRVVESANLRIQEATLTGESDAVEKNANFLSTEDLPLGDRSNMAYMGTIVTYGRGQALVIATGMKTELGKIASMLQNVEQEITPMQKRLDQVGRSLIFGIVLFVAAIFILGLLRGENLQLMLLTSVSLAVAAVPEALPAVVTITLALGAQRMLSRQALIRKLPAVETLGSITVICSDKTGTLTENRMTLTSLASIEKELDITREISESDKSIDPNLVKLLLVGGSLCTDVILKVGTKGKDAIDAVGDPTETALVVAAAKQNLLKTEIEKTLPRKAELSFDSDRKRMTTVHKVKQLPTELNFITKSLEAQSNKDFPYISFTKGAVGGLLKVSDYVLKGEKIEPLTQSDREQILKTQNKMSETGKRVLGLAFRPLNSTETEHVEEKLIFIGMFGMIDPARPEVKAAVETCKTAGIRTIMITGDHPLTAKYIASDLSISTNGRILTGQEIDQLSPSEFTKLVSEVSIYARVAPEHKLKIVEALQNIGQIVAMTGDGVNDAPALKKADIGVAMGITGTDVSKEASDMVLLNDNFATIVSAIEEGRVIYDNIKKYIKQTLTGNLGAIWVTLIAPIIGMPLPLLPLQLLWLNLVADGLPSVALGLEPAEKNIMHRQPNNPNEKIFNKKTITQILWGGILIGTVLVITGYWYWSSKNPVWQTMVLTTIIFSRMNLIMAIRSSRDSLFKIGLLSNKPLLGAISLTILSQIAIIYTPFLQRFFGTVALPLSDLAISVGLSMIIFVALEIEKWIARHKPEDKINLTELHSNTNLG